MSEEQAGRPLAAAPDEKRSDVNGSGAAPLPSAAPRPVYEPDPEFVAMDACVHELGRLGEEARKRVLSYLESRFRPKPAVSFQLRSPFASYTSGVEAMELQKAGAKP